MTAGTLSKPFDISNRTRQGCPLSPIMFALIIEPLAANIRADLLVLGILFHGLEHRVNRFAYDISLIISNPTQFLLVIRDILTKPTLTHVLLHMFQPLVTISEMYLLLAFIASKAF